MKEATIRFRLSDTEKRDLERFAENSSRSMSQIIRKAVAETLVGKIPGMALRSAVTELRMAANAVLDTIERQHCEPRDLKEATARLQVAVRRVMSCG
jgi:hypothetical protein